MSTTVALVTGAGSGIGRAIALGFAARGDRVIAADLDLPAAESTAKEHPKFKLIAALPVDVALRTQVDTLRDRARAEVGVTNVVVNAAGWHRTDQFLNATTEFAEKVVAINYLRPVTCAAPSCRELSRRAVADASSTWPATRSALAAREKPSTQEPRAASSRRPNRWPGKWPATRSLSTASAPARPTPRCSMLSPRSSKRRWSKRSVSAAGPARGSRRARAVLRVRIGVVHHRAGAQRQRRAHDGRLTPKTRPGRRHERRTDIRSRAPPIPGTGQ